MKSHLTSFGTPGIGVVPYGVHMCRFYPSRQDLIDGLIPYFLAGLENNERCIWMASASLPAGEIEIEIARSPELARGVAARQFVIADAIDWYGDPATLQADEIIRRLIDEEERALADGSQGLRIAGNMSFIPRAHWDRLMDYENRLNHWLKDRRILMCCNYHRGECWPVDVLEVVHRHDGALDRAGKHWHVFFAPPRPALCNA
ncbi:MAG: MEDS domain-containing protein [Rhizomicrobium sp.]